MKKTVSFFALIFLLFSSGPRAQAGVLLQGFYWDAPSDAQNTWWDQLARHSHEIAASGFTGVWIPPVLKGAAGGYSNGYDPYDDYDIGSKDQRDTIPTRWGWREDLLRSVAVMRSNGLEVYVDMVLAHRNGDSGDHKLSYRDAYGHPGGGRFPKGPDDFTGDSSGFGRNFDHGRPYVKDGLKEAGDWLLKTLGVQGVRIDLASKVQPEFLSEYLHHGAMNGKFAVSEYWEENVDQLIHYLSRMNGRVSAFDFPLWGRLKDMSNAKGFFNMRLLQGAGLIARDPARAVTFVENHDTDRGFPTLVNKHLGYAFILTSEGYPSVFWKDYYVHGMKKIIDPLIWIHEKLAAGPTEWRWADDDLLVYERRGGPGLLVGLNDNSENERTELVQTAFGARVKLHDYTGNKPDLETDDHGKVRITVGANSYVAYAPLGQDSPFSRASFEVTQEFAGNTDLDLPPADMKNWQQAGRIWVQEGTHIQLRLSFAAKQWAPKSRMHLEITFPGGSSEAITYDQEQVSKSITARNSGWHNLKIKATDLPEAEALVPYWLMVTYKAPSGL